jgi:hypothetical protein
LILSNFATIYYQHHWTFHPQRVEIPFLGRHKNTPINLLVPSSRG